MNIWFTSDTHAFHKNICRGSSQWDKSRGGQRLRDFDDQYIMTEKLIQNINAKVGQDDVLWHLGDWSFGGIDKIWDFRKRLVCKNIHLVFGNHDHHIEDKDRILPNVISAEPYSSNFIDGKSVDPEYPDYVTSQRLFSSCQYYKELSINGTKFVLSHFAFRVWNKMHHGAVHLYGHSHGTLKDGYGRSMDVGVDTHPEFRPYHIDEIKKIMNKRDVLIVDHHNSETN